MHRKQVFSSAPKLRTRKVACSLFAALSLLAITSSAQDAGPNGAGQRVAGSRPECVIVRQYSVFNGSGYNQLVEIRNQCRATVRCAATSNVNPQPTNATVPAGQVQTVSTFFNAAAYGFVANVQCDGG